VIYLDTSVALAELFAEDRRPADALWREPLALATYGERMRACAEGMGIRLAAI
jgi:hypothetical protein